MRRVFVTLGKALCVAFTVLFLFGGPEGFLVSLLVFPLALACFVAALACATSEAEGFVEPEEDLGKLDLREARLEGRT